MLSLRAGHDGPRDAGRILSCGLCVFLQPPLGAGDDVTDQTPALGLQARGRKIGGEHPHAIGACQVGMIHVQLCQILDAPPPGQTGKSARSLIVEEGESRRPIRAQMDVDIAGP